MTERADDSEALLKELLKETVLKTPSRDFTAQLMLQVAQQNKFKVEMKRRLFQQKLTLLFTAAISILGYIYMGLNYFKIPQTMQLGNAISTHVFNITQHVVSNINELYYFVIPIVALWLIDRLYQNFRVTYQK